MKDLKESFAEINQRWKDCYDDERIPDECRRIYINFGLLLEDLQNMTEWSFYSIIKDIRLEGNVVLLTKDLRVFESECLSICDLIEIREPIRPFWKTFPDRLMAMTDRLFTRAKFYNVNYN